MRKKLPLYIGVVFISLLVTSLVLYLRYYNILPQTQEELESNTFSTEDVGQIDVSEIHTRRQLPYTKIQLGKVWVRDIGSRTITTNDQKYNVVDLTIGYLKNGKEMELTAPLVDSVYYVVVTDDTDKYEDGVDDKGIVPVYSIPFRKGEGLTIIFAYLPLDEDIAQFSSYCEGNISDIVCGYRDLGFGDASISFENYITDVEKSNQKIIDHKKAVATTIFRNTITPPRNE